MTIPHPHLRVALAMLVLLPLAVNARGAASQTPVDTHVAAARAAAGDEYTALFELCEPPAPPEPPQPAAARGATPRPAVPDRAEWHAEPVKVFDNLYFVGTQEHTAWAVVTSAGIIIIDPLFAYAV